MGRITSPAIVMRKMDFGESSRIVRLFTRKEGLFSALAKGAHRRKSKFIGALDLFSTVDATIEIKTARELQLLYDADLTKSHRNLAFDPIRLTAASILVETAEAALPQGRPDKDLFDLLDSGLTLMERFPTNRIILAVCAWQTRFLEVLGQGFNLQGCALCGKPLIEMGDLLLFSPIQGGLICNTHGNQGEVASKEVLKLLTLFQSASASQLAALSFHWIALSQVSDILEKATSHWLEKKIKSIQVLRKMSRQSRQLD